MKSEIDSGTFEIINMDDAIEIKKRLMVLDQTCISWWEELSRKDNALSGRIAALEETIKAQEEDDFTEATK